MSQQLKDRVDAANELASLALDNDRNKKIIVEEGGIGPLLKLLKEAASPQAQFAAATALYNIGTFIHTNQSYLRKDSNVMLLLVLVCN